MTCDNMRHFIWIFTVCQGTRFGVSGLLRIKCSIDNFVHLKFSDPRNVEYNEVRIFLSVCDDDVF